MVVLASLKLLLLDKMASPEVPVEHVDVLVVGGGPAGM